MINVVLYRPEKPQHGFFHGDPCKGNKHACVVPDHLLPDAAAPEVHHNIWEKTLHGGCPAFFDRYLAGGAVSLKVSGIHRSGCQDGGLHNPRPDCQ